MVIFAGRGEPQQPGSHTSHQQQVGRGGTVIQRRPAAAAGRRNHVDQPPKTEKRPSPSSHGQMMLKQHQNWTFNRPRITDNTLPLSPLPHDCTSTHARDCSTFFFHRFKSRSSRVNTKLPVDRYTARRVKTCTFIIFLLLYSKNTYNRRNRFPRWFSDRSICASSGDGTNRLQRKRLRL